MGGLRRVQPFVDAEFTKRTLSFYSGNANAPYATQDLQTRPQRSGAVFLALQASAVASFTFFTSSFKETDVVVHRWSITQRSSRVGQAEQWG